MGGKYKMDGRFWMVWMVLVFVAFLVLNQVERFIGEAGGMPESTQLYVINLQRSRSRMEHFQKSLSSSDLNIGFQRVEAVDHKSMDIQKYVSPEAFAELRQNERRGYRERHYELTRGAVGCYMSHLKAWAMFSESPYSIAIVCEDDATFHPGIRKKLSKNLLHIPDDWDLVLLGYFCIRCSDRRKYIKVRRFHGTHGYIIRKQAARRLVSDPSILPITQQIDSLLSTFIELGRLNVYATGDTLVNQSHMFGSTIQSLPQKSINPANDPFSLPGIK